MHGSFLMCRMPVNALIFNSCSPNSHILLGVHISISLFRNIFVSAADAQQTNNVCLSMLMHL